MSSPSLNAALVGGRPRRHPVACYFVLTFAISWLAALAVAAPRLLRHQPLTRLTGILMFPAMLLGPSLAGIILTRATEGREGLRRLFRRMAWSSLPLPWCAALLIPPALILGVLLILATFVSSAYAPNVFGIGVLFGVPAGLLEEIGWTGYAFPKMRSPGHWIGPSVLLGLLWAGWHIPVVNYLGVATPHGRYWLHFFLAFALAMTAMRVLISWLYVNTGSVLLAQLMHISSTGSLVVFGAAHVTAVQEAKWYALYGIALWLVVAMVGRESCARNRAEEE